MSELPMGWIATEIGQIADVETGSTPPTARVDYYGGDIPFFKPGDLEQGRELSVVENTLTKHGASVARKLPAGSVLVTCIGNLGKSGIARQPSATNQQINAILPTAAASPEFVYYWTKTIRGWLEDNASATTLTIINKGRFARAPIPLPPIAEQGRIVAKLDSLFSRTNAANDELNRIPLLIEHYKQAILEKAFAGAFAGTSSAEDVALRSYIAGLDQGWSPKCEAFASDDPEKWAVIKTTAIQPLRLLKSENKVLPRALSPRPHIQIERNDILITRAGPRSRAGISCLVTESRPKLMLCDKAYRLRVRTNQADPAFVMLMLNAPQALSQIEEMKTGISDSGLNLTQEKLLDLILPALTLEQQRHTVRRVKEAMAWLDTVGGGQDKAAQLLSHLDQGLLAKAFRGELVSQDPNDEPAERLLERTRTTRTSQPKARRGRRTSTSEF